VLRKYNYINALLDFFSICFKSRTTPLNFLSSYFREIWKK